MKKHNLAALLFGDNEHHLDHLAPLAALLQIPLLIENRRLLKLANQYYKGVQISPFDPHLLPASLEAIISCLPAPYLKHQLLGLQIPTIWLPHGNSDKGMHSYFMEGLREESFAFIYGEKMKAFLQEKKAFANLKKYAFIGNYRLEYFRQYQKRMRFSQQTTILYAPSWQPEKNTHILIEELTAILQLKNVHILVKLHPNTIKLSHPTLYLLLEDCPHVTCVHDVPTIYPLLAATDLFIGDISSIGYDFLSFNRPLLFIENRLKEHMQKGALPLQQAGHTIHNLSQLEEGIEYALNCTKYEQKRDSLYNNTFSQARWMLDQRAIDWQFS